MSNCKSSKLACNYKIAKFQGGKILDTELITKNFALVKYTPEEFNMQNEGNFKLPSI